MYVSFCHDQIFAVIINLYQSAIVDFKETGEARHGARITPQAERPIPALDGLDLSL